MRSLLGLFLCAVPVVAADKPAVLLVIANQDFFYREYSDPKQELEKAGFRVEIAAGRKEVCRPHANSGQGSDGGNVTPTVALTDVDMSKYEAIIFAGGWGASMYQYAFQGKYDNGSYNGEQKIRESANKLINEAVKGDKYVCGVCHGVSVLAWARVNSKSVLDGKNVSAAALPGPAFSLNGKAQQPASSGHSEMNGAKVAPSQSIGNPRTATDDVVVDGKIITAENDQSAREFGKVLAGKLKK